MYLIVWTWDAGRLLLVHISDMLELMMTALRRGVVTAYMTSQNTQEPGLRRPQEYPGMFGREFASPYVQQGSMGKDNECLSAHNGSSTIQFIKTSELRRLNRPLPCRSIRVHLGHNCTCTFHEKVSAFSFKRNAWRHVRQRHFRTRHVFILYITSKSTCVPRYYAVVGTSDCWIGRWIEKLWNQYKGTSKLM